MRTHALLLLLGASCLLSAQDGPDLTIDTSYVTIPENAMARGDMLAAQHFLARIRNDGVDAADNFTLSFTIRNSNSPSDDLYTAEVVVAGLAAGEAVDVLINEEPFYYFDAIPITWPATYEIEYQIGTVEGEKIVDNNVYAVTWNSSSNYLAKESGATTSIVLSTPGQHSFGTCFYMNKVLEYEYYYTAFQINNVPDLIANTEFEGRILTLLYESTGDVNMNGTLDSLECTLKYFNEYALSPQDDGQLVIFPIDVDEEFPEFLEGKYYVI